MIFGKGLVRPFSAPGVDSRGDLRATNPRNHIHQMHLSCSESGETVPFLASRKSSPFKLLVASQHHFKPIHTLSNRQLKST